MIIISCHIIWLPSGNEGHVLEYLQQEDTPSSDLPGLPLPSLLGSWIWIKDQGSRIKDHKSSALYTFLGPKAIDSWWIGYRDCKKSKDQSREWMEWLIEKVHMKDDGPSFRTSLKNDMWALALLWVLPSISALPRLHKLWWSRFNRLWISLVEDICLIATPPPFPSPLYLSSVLHLLYLSSNFPLSFLHLSSLFSLPSTSLHLFYISPKLIESSMLDQYNLSTSNWSYIRNHGIPAAISSRTASR